MLKSVLAGMLLLLGAATAADAQTVSGIDIYEYGNYRSAEGVDVGKTREGFESTRVPEIYLVERTRTVIAQIGAHIGFRFRITGKPLRTPVPIRLVAKFPSPGLLPPHRKTRVMNDELWELAVMGADWFWTWDFKERSDLVPGIWTLEVWQGDRKLGEQKFNVILPPIS